MHPAPSLVVFTVVSGAGYGLLALTGLLHAAGLLAAERGVGTAALGLALVLIASGLTASTLHLRHPERAWRALTQWRTSWLSREGVMALSTFVPAVGFLLALSTLDGDPSTSRGFGLAAAVGALATVYCTGQIYASLKPVRSWHHPLTMPLYLAFALATGALWLNALMHAFGAGRIEWDAATLVLLAFAWAGALGSWRVAARGNAPETTATATGLGAFGPVRLLDAPHGGENYLLREMAFILARKHATKLRRIALGCGLATPAGLLAPAPFAGETAGIILSFLAAGSGFFGALIARWLFFAEASHTVRLYYGLERRAGTALD